MSTETRRIKKVVRQSENKLLNKAGQRNLFKKIADDVNADWGKNTSEVPRPITKGERNRVLAYALTKARVVEGCVTLPQLAAECGMQAQLARLWIKAAGIKKPGDRWVWKEGSKALAQVRTALGLEP